MRLMWMAILRLGMASHFRFVVWPHVTESSTVKRLNALVETNQVIAVLSRECDYQLHWLVTDQLGTPRMVFDQSGSLASVSRHDYLPFGEELFAGTGGRTAAQGYTGDSTRQKFTGYEADSETGLNFAQARYQSSSQG